MISALSIGLLERWKEWINGIWDFRVLFEERVGELQGMWIFLHFSKSKGRFLFFLLSLQLFKKVRDSTT